MASHSYMTITGKKQGLISAGCSTQDSIGNKCQNGHTDQIMVLAVNHALSATGNPRHATHHPIHTTKNIDKSSPLLAGALDRREEIECVIDLYRSSPQGSQELYFTIKIEGGQLASLDFDVPHSVTMGDSEPQELLAIRYRSITWTHHAAGTSGYGVWGNAE